MKTETEYESMHDNDWHDGVITIGESKRLTQLVMVREATNSTESYTPEDFNFLFNTIERYQFANDRKVRVARNAG